MIRYNAFPPTVLHVSPLLCTLTRVGIAMLPWQICYLQHHLPTHKEGRHLIFTQLCTPALGTSWRLAGSAQLQIPRTGLCWWPITVTDGRENPVGKTQHRGAGQGNVLALLTYDSRQVALHTDPTADGITLPSAWQDFGEEGLKIPEGLFTADTAKLQSVKHFEGRAGSKCSVRNPTLKKESPVNPHLHPAAYKISLWWQQRPHSSLHPTHPTKPTQVDFLKYQIYWVGKPQGPCLLHTTQVQN